jgi:hypothetical protein
MTLINDHLQLIRAHAYSLLDDFKDRTGGKSAEIRSCLWGILDGVVHIENTLPGGGISDGRSDKDDSQGGATGQGVHSKVP